MNPRSHSADTLALAIAISAAIGSFTAGAAAQWTAVSLTPTGMSESAALGADGSQQVGFVRVGASEHAALWSGAADSWVDLNPAGATESVAFAIHSGVQVGYARFAGHNHAGLWSGTAASWVDLSPPGSTDSYVLALTGSEQAGYAYFGGSAYHAVRWTGASVSAVDLNPAGALTSTANAAATGQESGFAEVSAGVVHAALWSGSAGSWLDLNPSGASQSIIRGATDGQQVGNTIAFDYSGQYYMGEASLWNGTAASWRSLNPAGASYSLAFGGDTGLQAGQAGFSPNSFARAGVWGGTAATWVDLAAFLTPDDPSVETVARAVSHVGDVTYVVGYALNGSTGEQTGLMWVGNGCNPLMAFTSQPASVTYLAGATVTFSATTNLTPTTLHWRHNGQPLTDGPNISGSSTGTLTVTSAQDADQGIYECVAAGACNSTTSDPAVLTCNPILVGHPPIRVYNRPGVQLAVTSAPDVTYSYHWRRDSVELADVPGQLSGVLTPILTLLSGDPSLNGFYDVVVMGDCGTSTSPSTQVGTCFADFNADGDIGTDADISDFFSCIAGACCPTCGTADFNGDGDVGTDADIESFFRVLGGGNC